MLVVYSFIANVDGIWFLLYLTADRVSLSFQEFHEDLGQEFTTTVNPLLNNIRELDLSTNATMLMKVRVHLPF